jgi:hypothetical protein
MTNYVTMRTRIADEMLNSSLTNSHINNAIQSAIKYYERSEFYFNQSYATFNTVAGQEWYGASDLAAIPDMAEIKTITVSSSGVSIGISSLDYVEMQETQTGNFTGYPKAFCYYGQRIRLYPIPDQAYQCTVSYVQRFPALSGDTDTNAWMTEAEELIRNASKLRLAVDVLKDDADAARFSARALDCLDKLEQETGRRIPARLLRTQIPSANQSFNIIRGY